MKSRIKFLREGLALIDEKSSFSRKVDSIRLEIGDSKCLDHRRVELPELSSVQKSREGVKEVLIWTVEKGSKEEVNKTADVPDSDQQAKTDHASDGNRSRPGQ